MRVHHDLPRIVPRPLWRLLALITSLALAAGLLLTNIGVISASSTGEAANLNQCRNGAFASPVTCSGSNFQNGNLGSTNSHYREGDSVPFQTIVTGLTAGSHTINITWAETASSKHAYDYLDTYTQSETTADACVGVLTSTQCGQVSTIAIPRDPLLVNAANTASVCAGFNPHFPPGQIPGVITVYGDSSAAGSFSYVNSPASCQGSANSQSANITFTTTASQTSVVLAWGGHIATSIDWGQGNSASAVSGSPYHMSLNTLDGASTGAQDRSIKAAAVLPEPTIVTQVSNGGTVTIGTGFTDLATLSGPNGTPTGTIDFYDCGPTASPTPCSTSGSPNAGTGVALNAQGQATSTTVTPTTLTNAAGDYYCFAVVYHPALTSAYSPAQSTTTTNECEKVIPGTVSLTTTASGPVIVGQTITDVAHLAGGAAPVTGTITFNVYGPGDTTCATSLGTVAATASVSGDGDYTSNPFTTTHTGTYRWIAHFTDGTNNPSVSTSCNDANESSAVNAATPSLTTTASGPVTVGASITDTAHLTGGYGTLTGSISFQVFAPADTTCASPLATLAATTSVSGTGNYTSNPFTTTQTGSYLWKASFTDTDGNNNNVSTNCNDANESSAVGPATPGVTTTATASVTVGAPITDTAHLTGGYGALAGTMSFQVFAPGDTTCATPLTPAPASATVSGTGNYTSGPFTTTQTGTYRWKASFTDTDGNNNNVSTNCNDTNESSAVGPATPTLSTTASSGTLGATITDVAHLGGGYGALAGTITFTLFNNLSCSGSPIDSETVTVAGAGDYTTPAGKTITAAGTYEWIASYSGDGNNSAVATTCGDEPVTISQASPSVVTLDGGPVVVGSGVKLTDTASLSGGFNPVGSITFNLYAPDGTTVVYTDVVTVNGDGTYTTASGNNPGGYLPTSTGIYEWVASYSGDANNSASVSAFGEEPEAVNPASPSSSTAQTLTPNDSFALSGGFNPTGTVTFKLFSPSDAQCSGTPALLQTVSVSGNGTYSTSNTTFFASAVGTWRWLVSYSGDANNTPSVSSCGVEQFSIANQ